MTELEGVCDAAKMRIEAKIRRTQGIQNLMRNQRIEVQELQSGSADDVEASLRDSLKIANENTAILNSKIVAERKIVDQKREEAARILSDKEGIERRQIEELKSYINEVSAVIPTFRDALTDYSEENLTRNIHQIRLEGRKLREDIVNVDREIATLASKYGLNGIGSTVILGYNSEIAELRVANAISTEFKSNTALTRKQIQLFDKELEKKAERNKRAIANLESTE